MPRREAISSTVRFLCEAAEASPRWRGFPSPAVVPTDDGAAEETCGRFRLVVTMATISRDELIARNRARAKRLRSPGGLYHPPAPVPTWRRVIRFVFAVVGWVYTAFVIGVLLVVTKMIYGDGAVTETIAAVFPGVTLLALFTLLLTFCWHYFRTLAMILYLAFCTVGGVIGVAEGDPNVTQPLWCLAILFGFLMILRLFRKPAAPLDPRRLPG
jgi:hypothetical protein